MSFSINDQVNHTIEVVRQKAGHLSDDLTLLGLGCALKSVGGNPRVTIVEPTLNEEELIFNISVTNEVPELRRLRREIEYIGRNTGTQYCHECVPRC